VIGAARTAVVAGVMLVSALSFTRELDRSQPGSGIGGAAGTLLRAAERTVLRWGEPILAWTDPFRTINGYGLFRVMTTERPEIIVEGSRDGVDWREYAFRWKPGDVERRPRFVAPHQPRLDWQMWFAALSPARERFWIERFVTRLLQGSPAVLGLLEGEPFPGGPPRYVRLVLYRYEFSSQDGAWWRRQRLRELLGPVALADVGGASPAARRP
jgi:hypothetical protein